jgi:hypothetical protein
MVIFPHAPLSYIILQTISTVILESPSVENKGVNVTLGSYSAQHKEFLILGKSVGEKRDLGIQDFSFCAKMFGIPAFFYLCRYNYVWRPSCLPISSKSASTNVISSCYIYFHRWQYAPQLRTTRINYHYQ